MAKAPRSVSAAPSRTRKPPVSAAPGADTASAAAPADGVQQMIAEAAYYRAESRGFQGGDPVEDWLIAEAEINARIQSVH